MNKQKIKNMPMVHFIMNFQINKMRSRFLLVGFILFSFAGVHAQQDPMYTHYLFNTLSINPGYAGSRGVLSLSALSRMQWVGIDGAPLTQTFVAHTPFINYNMGLGFTVVNDRIGPINQTLLFVDYSYTVRVNDNSKLSFGLKGGMDLLAAKLTSVETGDATDEAFKSDISGKILPNFGFGMFYHSDRWYIGLSTPKLLENKIEGTTQVTEISQSRHYFLICGYVLDINEHIKFKPTTMVKITSGAPVSFDLTANFLFREKLLLGAAYRRGESFGALLELKITDQLRAGYAYDFMVSDLRKASAGSHEIMIGYDFNYKREKMLSPRYF